MKGVMKGKEKKKKNEALHLTEYFKTMKLY